MTQRPRGVTQESVAISQQPDRVPVQSRDAADPMTARLPLIGLIAVQMFIGYEWFISGLTKIVRGGFPAGLADELTEKSEGAPAWYASLIDEVAIPNAEAFGYIIEVGELLMGAALIGAGLIWLLMWDRLGRGLKVGTLAVIVVAALAGVVLNVNLHLANGSAHPWLLPGDGFDEGVDLDSLMPAIQLALAGVAAALLRLTLRQSDSAGSDESNPAGRGH